MKNLKTWLFYFTIPFFIFCTPEKSDYKLDKKYPTENLIGKWNQVNKNKSVLESNPKVEFFQIVNDSVVNLQIIENNIKRKISGKWENGFTKKTGSAKIEFKSDIKITCFLNDNHQYVLLFKLGEEKGKTIMVANKYKFQKE